MSALRAMIVDDEPLARARLRRLLADHADVAVIAEWADARSARAAVAREPPDLLFLDIQLPESDGFMVRAGVALRTAVVFVTAYQEYAAQAFDSDAVDYLVKPIDGARLARALDRARRHHHGSLLPAPPPPARIAVRDKERTELIDLDDVDYLTAEGNYVALHAAGRVHLMRATMSQLERRLDPRQFVRIHRSRLVRIDRVRVLEPLFHGEYRLTLRDGTQLTSARNYREALRRALGLASDITTE